MFDVETDEDDVGVILEELGDVFEELSEDALSAVIGVNVDALNPGGPAIAPVGPFAGEHDLSDDGVVIFGDEVLDFVSLWKGALDAAGDDVSGEGFVFGFVGEAAVEVGDDVGFGGGGGSEGEGHRDGR